MVKLLWFRRLVRQGSSLSLWCLRHSFKRFFRKYALAAAGCVASWLLHSSSLSYVLFFEIPVGRSRGHTRRLHVSTAGVWLYDVERALDSAVQLSIVGGDTKEAAAQVKNCDGYFTESDPRRQGVVYASTVAMAHRIRIA